MLLGILHPRHFGERTCTGEGRTVLSNAHVQWVFLFCSRVLKRQEEVAVLARAKTLWLSRSGHFSHLCVC